ncbi:MAG: 1-acyl-sn-glycerol-3-phosphate acyltransferase [Bacteroidetes bacterium]|nr:1-acyl-sn-glycerol-3-phosphate acyltransferase [Bacteroidota bacterium]MBL6943576.1 1-acyl-sn-glycerol-3-phosphate acyltransferase [Bacteroidales bacterium]
MNNSATSSERELLKIEKVLSDKSPFLKKILPGFAINYLKRLIHEDELNEYLIKHGHLMGIDFIEAILSELNIKLDIIGLNNIPEEGRCIIVSNHPLGGIDGLALMLAVGKVRNDLVFPVNDILMNLKNLEPLFIPINKHGSNAQNIQIINDTFASNKIVCYFPFGLVSRKRKGVIKDIEWKSTFISKAKRYKRDLIPTHINGHNTNFFYNLANLRKNLGIKANIEMLFLVDEFFKQRNGTLKISFGPAVPYNTFDNRHSKSEWAELMRQYSYKLGEGCNKPFEM